MLVTKSLAGMLVIFVAVALSTAVLSTAQAQVPQGYYDTVDATSGENLRRTLHEVIDDHTRFPYSSTSTDTWNILELADQVPWPADEGSLSD